MLRDEYISRTDGKRWGVKFTSADPGSEPEQEIGIHDIHRHVMLDEDGAPSACDVCHMGSGDLRYPVFTNQSVTTYFASTG